MNRSHKKRGKEKRKKEMERTGRIEVTQEIKEGKNKWKGEDGEK